MANNVDQDRHVKLPCLKSISVQDYALFTNNWEYKLKPGMNLFLGVNGVGKTTTTNLIIYGLIGYQTNQGNCIIINNYYLIK